jgi:hypothetical protein
MSRRLSSAVFQQVQHSPPPAKSWETCAVGGEEKVTRVGVSRIFGMGESVAYPEQLCRDEGSDNGQQRMQEEPCSSHSSRDQVSGKPWDQPWPSSGDKGVTAGIEVIRTSLRVHGLVSADLAYTATKIL